MNCSELRFCEVKFGCFIIVMSIVGILSMCVVCFCFIVFSMRVGLKSGGRISVVLVCIGLSMLMM